jgi:hypothetical protein
MNTGQMRGWLEPLLALLPEKEEMNVQPVGNRQYVNHNNNQR